MPGLLFYMHDGPNAFRFELSGSLAGADVNKLDQAWRTATSTFDGKVLAVDVTYLKEMDEKGRDLLIRWSRAGACFVASSEESQNLAESITGQPYAPPDAAVGPTFEPHFTTFRAGMVALVVTMALLFPMTASAGEVTLHVGRKTLAALVLFAAVPSFAAELKRETLDAWDQYLAAANAGMLDRAKGHFLWTDESADRLRQVRAGEVVVSPLGQTPEAVPTGLIHHWIGAAFIPGARIDDVIAVVRNYNRYTEFYKPSVIAAKTLSQKAAEDRFYVVIADKAMFMRRAFNSEYQSRFVEVDGGKWYNVAETTRVRELSDEGTIPDGEGSGYIWRLCTISRYEERDHGVYIEIEAVALSRPIPAVLHLVVDHIVRRVSRSTLTTTLEQTRDATGALVKSASTLSAAGRIGRSGMKR